MKGYMGFGPKLCADRYRTSGGSRGSGRPVHVGRPVFWHWTGGVGRPVGVGHPVAGASSGWDLAGWLELQVLVVRAWSVVQQLEISRLLSFSFLVLGVLAVLSVGCSSSVAFLQVPDHA